MDQQDIVSHKSECMQLKTIRNIHQQIVYVLKYSMGWLQWVGALKL